MSSTLDQFQRIVRRDAVAVRDVLQGDKNCLALRREAKRGRRALLERF